jgi:hypothetical protein
LLFCEQYKPALTAIVNLKEPIFPELTKYT